MHTIALVRLGHKVDPIDVARRIERALLCAPDGNRHPIGIIGLVFISRAQVVPLQDIGLVDSIAALLAHRDHDLSGVCALVPELDARRERALGLVIVDQEHGSDRVPFDNRHLGCQNGVDAGG